MKLHITNVEFHFKIYIELNCEDIKFYTKLDFVKIELKKKDILLNSFKTGIFCYIICKLRTNAHFKSFWIYTIVSLFKKTLISSSHVCVKKYLVFKKKKRKKKRRSQIPISPMVMHANTPKKKTCEWLRGKKASYSNHCMFYMSEIMKKLKGCENYRNTLPSCFCRIQNNQQRIQLFQSKF